MKFSYLLWKKCAFVFVHPLHPRNVARFLSFKFNLLRNGLDRVHPYLLHDYLSFWIFNYISETRIKTRRSVCLRAGEFLVNLALYLVSCSLSRSIKVSLPLSPPFNFQNTTRTTRIMMRAVWGGWATVLASWIRLAPLHNQPLNAKRESPQFQRMRKSPNARSSSRWQDFSNRLTSINLVRMWAILVNCLRN